MRIKRILLELWSSSTHHFADVSVHWSYLETGKKVSNGTSQIKTWGHWEPYSCGPSTESTAKHWPYPALLKLTAASHIKYSSAVQVKVYLKKQLYYEKYKVIVWSCLWSPNTGKIMTMNLITSLASLGFWIITGSHNKLPLLHWIRQFTSAKKKKSLSQDQTK